MWDRIESDWRSFREHARREWSRLTEAHLDEIGGRRDRLRRHVRKVYDVGDDEAGRQVDAWERSLRGVEPVPRDDSDPSAYPPGRHAQSIYDGTAAAAETRNAGGGAGGDSWRSPQHPRADGGVFDNPGQELGEHDRPGGAGMPSNQAGGRDPGPVAG
jgi:uncharacterized protein YjbJ (UPF0337 family)